MISLATLAFAIVLFSRGNDAGVIFLCFALSPPVFAWFFLETRRIVSERDAATVTLEFRPCGHAGHDLRWLGAGARVEVQRPDRPRRRDACLRTARPGPRRARCLWRQTARRCRSPKATRRGRSLRGDAGERLA
ncbi:MAG: hypothetical protein R3D80_19985 [Paracoccaceae bacterium]